MTEVLSREIQPLIKDVDKIPFDMPEHVAFKNGIDLYYYSDQSEVLRIEWVFKAGARFSTQRLVSSLTNRLITSGTSEWNAKEIAEKLDFYGAYFEKHSGSDFASLTLYTLEKYAIELVKVVSEILRAASFPEEEFETEKNIRRQKFLVNSEKVSFLSKREFTDSIFGKNHPYGGKTEARHFDNLKREDVVSFFNEFYQEPPTILLAGKVSTDLIKTLEEEFSGIQSKLNGKSEGSAISETSSNRIIIEKEGAVQSAIRIGKRLFNKTHQDYTEMIVLSTVLGGYFGSRLMSNLREDKGFTYGVGSGLASLQLDGYFFISTEVGADVTKKAEFEIRKEIDLLREELIPMKELVTVKNYLMGELLRSSDGVFSRMDRFKGILLYNLDESSFHEKVDRIKAVGPERLRELAQKWLNPASFTTVIAGRE